MAQQNTIAAGEISGETFRSDLSANDWGRGLLHRVDRACAHEAFVRFSSLQVEMPSRRWLQEAIDPQYAGACRERAAP